MIKKKKCQTCGKIVRYSVKWYKRIEDDCPKCYALNLGITTGEMMWGQILEKKDYPELYQAVKDLEITYDGKQEFKLPNLQNIYKKN